MLCRILKIRFIYWMDIDNRVLTHLWLIEGGRGEHIQRFLVFSEMWDGNPQIQPKSVEYKRKEREI